MTIKRALAVGAGVVLFVIIVGFSFLHGENYALGGMSIASATPAEMAQAMGNDDFWGMWRERTLLVNGTVAGVLQQNGTTQIEFVTNSVLKAYCDLGSASTSIRAGDTIRIAAEGFTAQRLPSGVLLTNCVAL